MHKIGNIQPCDEQTKECRICTPPPFYRENKYHQWQKSETKGEVYIKGDILHGRHLFVLFKQPVLHTFDAVCHKPRGTMIAASEMGKQQMIAFGTHLICFFGELFWASTKPRIPARTNVIIILFFIVVTYDLFLFISLIGWCKDTSFLRERGNLYCTFATKSEPYTTFPIV